ncbi:MAG TPA: FAD-dependent oxidoreductase [Caulobacteraceae bacterium]|jgi:glycine oxidase
MADLQSLRVIVAGGGAVGSATALELAARGAAVTLTDPAPVGANASGVAAGMLAPAMEAALDPLSGGHFALFKAARELWPDFIERHRLQVEPHRCGAVWTGGADAAAKLLGRLQSFGAVVEAVEGAWVEAMSPGARPGEASVFTPEDWRLEPLPALRGLRRAFEALGGEVRADRLTRWSDGRAGFASGAALAADALVLATGAPPQGIAASLAAELQPIKGQIVRFPGARPTGGPVLRGAEAYLVPGSGGAMAGATMEAGRSDAAVDPEAVLRLREAAAWLAPWLRQARAEGLAGVRAGTADGLPLAGWSGEPGLLVALGARRNGWLLAPMLAETTADILTCRDSPWARALAPDRKFTHSKTVHVAHAPCLPRRWRGGRAAGRRALPGAME